MNIAEKIKNYFLNYKLPRYKAKDNWYATDMSRNMRDLYWERKGEESTNPTDLKGAIRMFIGKAIEVALVKDVFAQLHLFGLHMIGTAETQISISYTDPVHVSGLLDLLVCEKDGDKLKKPLVGEIKCVWGYGSDLIIRKFEPKTDHLLQMGSYLHRMSSLKHTTEGFLLYVPMEGDHLGEMIIFYCRFNPETAEITAFKAQTLSGIEKDINVTMNLKPGWERLKATEEYIAKNEVPPAEHYYKHPLTPQFLENASDAQIRDAIDGKKVLGDWQITYSKFFKKHLELEGSSRSYSEDEIKLLREEYLKRHPGSRKYK